MKLQTSSKESVRSLNAIALEKHLCLSNMIHVLIFPDSSGQIEQKKTLSEIIHALSLNCLVRTWQNISQYTIIKFVVSFADCVEFCHMKNTDGI
mmetsp:Transcript_22582/g.35119  ORF Transcript_22582/g.35119 Transcript_22582/m.35119 type:complete len:94 (+) Transcript_22582:269-550(+)